MQDLGMSPEAISSNNQNSCDGEEYSNETQELSEKPCEFEKPVLEKTEVIVLDDSPRKRQKVEVPEHRDHSLEITEASFLDWLQKFENGVSLNLGFRGCLDVCVKKANCNLTIRISV